MQLQQVFTGASKFNIGSSSPHATANNSQASDGTDDNFTESGISWNSGLPGITALSASPPPASLAGILQEPVLSSPSSGDSLNPANAQEVLQILQAPSGAWRWQWQQILPPPSSLL